MVTLMCVGTMAPTTSSNGTTCHRSRNLERTEYHRGLAANKLVRSRSRPPRERPNGGRGNRRVHRVRLEPLKRQDSDTLSGASRGSDHRRRVHPWCRLGGAVSMSDDRRSDTMTKHDLTSLPHPKSVLVLWHLGNEDRPEAMVTERHALLQREAEQDSTR